MQIWLTGIESLELKIITYCNNTVRMQFLFSDWLPTPAIDCYLYLEIQLGDTNCNFEKDHTVLGCYCFAAVFA